MHVRNPRGQIVVDNEAPEVDLFDVELEPLTEVPYLIAALANAIAERSDKTVRLTLHKTA